MNRGCRRGGFTRSTCQPREIPVKLVLIEVRYACSILCSLFWLLAFTGLLPANSSSLSERTAVRSHKPESSGCQQDIKMLTDQLLRDLPGYANRASQRARRLRRSTDVYTYVLVAGHPEFEPLSTAAGVYSPNPQMKAEDVRQVFFTTLERQYLGDRAVELEGFHWAFFTKTEAGWRLATMFTRIGDRAGKTPSPPEESSDGIIAQGIKTWLRDCQARDVRKSGIGH